MQVLLAGCLFGLLAAGCTEPTKPVGVTAAKRDTKLSEYVSKAPPPTTGLGKDNTITGSKEWNTGRTTEPQPKALEKEFVVQGTVSSSGAGSISIDTTTGGTRTFQTIPEIQIYSAGDPRFFAKPMPGPGAFVSVIAYTQGGQDYVRLIEIGQGGVIVPDKNKKK
jgi:hypothetical protein